MKQKSIVCVLFAGLALMLACQPKQQQVEQTEQKQPSIMVLDSGEVYTDSLLHQAELGIDSAQFLLAKAYYLGRGIDADEHKAFEWMKKSAEQGYFKAQSWLGLYYNSGVSVAPDKEKAKEWYLKAIQSQPNDSVTMFNLSGLYFQEEDYEHAWYWVNESAKRNYAPAFHFVACFYYHGFGGIVEKNQEEALKWFVKAAESGYPPAQYLLGLGYDYGYDVPQDHEKALYWIRKAAENGYQEAKDKLKEMEKN